MMLASGFVLILHALLTAFEAIFSTGGQMVTVSEKFGALSGLSVPLNVLYILFHLAIGYIGYKLWKNPTKKMIRIAFVAAAVLLALTLISMLLSNNVISKTNDVLLIADSVVMLVITAAYIVGAVFVRCRIDLGLLTKRDE